MLKTNTSYDAMYDSFNFTVPRHFNIGIDVCDKWFEKEPDRIALIHKLYNGSIQNYSFSDIYKQSNKFANVLADDGLQQMDRVAILLPQAPETAFSHVAVYKSGAIAVPLFSLFGEDALKYRLNDCGAKYLITDAEGADKIHLIIGDLPELKRVYVIEEFEISDEIFVSYHSKTENMSTEFVPVRTTADYPALIIYTSGTTGQPKGALHAHRTLLGHLPGVEMSHNFLPQQGDLFWTPADWAWIGGLLDVLLPAWHHGIPVVCHRFKKFTPERAFDLIEELNIRNIFFPPTALKMLMTVPDAEKKWKLNVRSIGSGGESLGMSLHTWGRKTFGLEINEFYGQTECNMVISSCSELFDSKPGSMGKAAPGSHVEIVDNAGNVLPPNEIGNIAIKTPAPTELICYWGNAIATANKYVGSWLLTGDMGTKDEQGYFTFLSRDDDVITSSGYRIGPGEIEDCLLSHPSVKVAAVVGVPDSKRTERVKAFIVLLDGVIETDDLKEQIQQFVKTKLAAHEYPRDIVFLDKLPMTATGKIIRRELKKM